MDGEGEASGGAEMQRSEEDEAMIRIRRSNEPRRVEHYCARCLGRVTSHATECPRCSRRFVGRGRFDRLSGSPPSRESIALLEATRS